MKTKLVSLIVLSAVVITACQHQTPAATTTKGEFTKQTEGQFGVFVKFYDMPEADAVALAKESEGQFQEFKVCGAGILEFNLRSAFEVAKSGKVRATKVISEFPADKGLKECFLKHIKDLRLSKAKKTRRGEVHFGSYQGTIPPWALKNEQKILVK